MKATAWFVATIASVSFGTAQIIDVPALSYDPGQVTTFTTNERIVLHVDVRAGDKYQARFLRGTKERLIGAIPLLTTAGCVEFRYVPFSATVNNGLVDLLYPRISPEWVRNDDGELEDEPYVIILEKINNPDYRSLRVKPEYARLYVQRGLQITLKAPPTPQPSLFARIADAFAGLFSTSAHAAPIKHPATTPGKPSGPPPSVAPPMNCIEIQH